ncbi:MAG: threonine ammonia-lyase [Bdellovibrionales bacterium]|nr:threonine ammonia-lyase [Bdellovibrionales bacterium]
MNPLQISMDDVKKAREVLSGVARKTPANLGLGRVLQNKGIYLKYENFQLTGSFKIRGAMNKLNSLTEEERARGVIAASAGNHAQGVAFGASKLGIQSTIVMPMAAPLIKVTATKAYGADVILHGRYFDEAFQEAKRLADEKGYVFIHPYQDPYVIAGQGTIGHEIFEALPQMKSVVIPIGGGGLISGIAYVLKNLNPQIKIYGVVSDQTPGMMEMKTGEHHVQPQFISTIADGIAVKNPSKEMFETYINKYVDDIVAVNDNEIAQAIVYCMEVEKVITEGSGAAGLAAVLNGKLDLPDPSLVLLCGGNIDLNTVSSVIEAGLRKQGRLTRISVIVNDLPGTLAEITNIFANERANVLDVIHDRVSPELGLRQTRIDFLLETMSLEHVANIKKTLREEKIWILEK